MAMLRTILLTIAAAMPLPLAAMQVDQVQSPSLPPNHQVGLDMVLIDPDAMPPEPELAGDLLDFQEEVSRGAPIDPSRPVHQLYSDLRRQLVHYQETWSSLPQVRVPVAGPPFGESAADPRLNILRERLGLPREGGYDDALRKKLAAFQQAHGLNSDGVVGADTLAALNRGAAHYERLIWLNMERARRLPAVGAASKYILVDAGSARLWMYEDGEVVDSMKVIVGAAASPTPMMAAPIRYANVNPYWNVPPELVQSLIAPRVISEGKSYLAARNYEVLDSWEQDAQAVDPDTIDWRAAAKGETEVRVRQLPGAGNSMGDIKFMMPNEYGIYLHDTPNKALFAQDNRWVSNGCVRLEDAGRLARWLFGDMPAPQDRSREARVELATPVPVYITYLTVAPEKEGMAFRSDPYQRDGTLLAKFDGRGDGMTNVPLAEVVVALAEVEAAAAADRRRNAAKPAPVARPARTTVTPAPARTAAQTTAQPASARSKARTTATAAPVQSAKRTTATAAPARTAAQTTAKPAAARSKARTTATAAPVQSAKRKTATSAPARTAAQTAAKPAPARGAKAQTPTTPAPARSAKAQTPARAAATGAKPAPKSNPAAAARGARVSAPRATR